MIFCFKSKTILEVFELRPPYLIDLTYRLFSTFKLNFFLKELGSSTLKISITNLSGSLSLNTLYSIDSFDSIVSLALSGLGQNLISLILLA